MIPYTGRREDQRLVTGHGQYTSDFNLPGQLHACFLRSDYAHARIVSIDTTAAKAAPGVRLILTGADFATGQFKTMIPMAQFPGRGGFKIRVPERLPLAHKKVNFGGEAVALVLADTAEQARDATELINVDYEDLPAIIGFDRALAPDAPAVHENVPGNITFDWDYGDEAKTNELFARADHVVKAVMESPRVAPTPMEPRAVVTSYDKGADLYTVRCEHQGLPAIRGAIAQIMGLDQAKLRMEFVDVGGAFGARTSPYLEYIALIHASKLADRPVKWVSTRSEDFLNDGHGRAIRLDGELALDKSGRFLAIRTKWLADTGAYHSQAGTLTNSGNGKTMAAGPYIVEAFYGHHLQVITNTAPTDAFRGAGRPEAAFVVERLVDEAALLLKMDPLELRRKNAIPKEAMPYTSVTGTVFDSADFRGMIDATERESNWKTFPARRAEAAKRGKLLGIGCGVFIEPSGGGGVPKDEAAVEFGKDGRIVLHIVAGASGQSHETIFPQMVGQWLGIDPGKIDLRAGDPDGPTLIGGPSIGSRTAMSAGSSFKAASDEIIHKGLDLAANDLEAPAADIEFINGKYVVKGTDRSIQLTDIIERHRGAGKHPLDTVGVSGAQRAFPSGAHVCEIEVDPDTGVCEIVSYTAVDDIGRAINPVMAIGQVHGGVVKSVGQVFGEQVVYDEETGQMLSGSFMDYTMPRAGCIREFRIADHSIPSPNNALGAKGAGEAGTTGALPTCMSAVLDALRSAGVKQFDMPATPGRVWQALQAARA